MGVSPIGSLSFKYSYFLHFHIFMGVINYLEKLLNTQNYGLEEVTPALNMAIFGMLNV